MPRLLASVFGVYGLVFWGYGQKAHFSTPLVSDSLVKREMALFTVADACNRQRSERLGVRLKNIGLYHADDSSASLEKGNWVAIHRLIHIRFEPFDTSKHRVIFSTGGDSCILRIDDAPFWGVSRGFPQRKVKEIFFFHVNARRVLPSSAFDGIFEPPVYYCKTKKDRAKYQPYFKAYLSEDNWRMYIYMMNGKGKDRYEVTWVMNGFDYFGRFINKIPE